MKRERVDLLLAIACIGFLLIGLACGVIGFLAYCFGW